MTAIDIAIRGNEGCDPDPFLLWDSVLFSIEDGTDFIGDWRLAGGAPLNAGGLQATAALDTAVSLALFTDTYCPPDHPLAYLADGDPRGCWQDGVDVRADLGEAPLGSLLWLLERAPLTVAGVGIEFWARNFAITALAPLQTQGAVVRVDAQAVADRENGRLLLSVQLYGREGAQLFDRRFELVWQQINGK